MSRRDGLARLLLVNLYVRSVPALVVPWLIATRAATRADAVLLQECTDRHARLMRRLSPRWALTREPGSTEAVWARRRDVTEAEVIPDVSGLWLGKHTGERHDARTLPLVVLWGWLRVGSIHFPPGWVDGPQDRRRAGLLYLVGLRALTLSYTGALVLGGDYNAKSSEPRLTRWRRARRMIAAGHTIDHAAVRGCRLASTRRLHKGPGMDHTPRLVVVERA